MVIERNDACQRAPMVLELGDVWVQGGARVWRHHVVKVMEDARKLRRRGDLGGGWRYRINSGDSGSGRNSGAGTSGGRNISGGYGYIGSDRCDGFDLCGCGDCRCINGDGCVRHIFGKRVSCIVSSDGAKSQLKWFGSQRKLKYNKCQNAKTPKRRNAETNIFVQGAALKCRYRVPTAACVVIRDGVLASPL